MSWYTSAALAVAIAMPAVVGCSENNLRAIYAEPEFFAQPDNLGPTVWTDRFQQRTVEASDILFVVDGSGSMGDEQEELAANFDAFIQSFVNSTLDYHIGVVNGDLDEDEPSDWGLLREYNGAKWIDPTTPDKVSAFNYLANVGSNGAGTCEMGLQASFSAIGYQSNPGAPNYGFYREDALLSVIIISDEIDHGQDGFLGGCGGIAPDEYIPWITYLKGNNSLDQVIFTGIVGDMPNGCDANGNNADPGEGYWDVIDAIDGNFLSVCSNDWSVFLTELGLEAAGLKRNFYLRRVPVEATVAVTIDGVAPDPSTWAYDRITNSVGFPLEFIPDELAFIDVTYELVEDTGSAPPVE